MLDVGILCDPRRLASRIALSIANRQRDREGQRIAGRRDRLYLGAILRDAERVQLALRARAAMRRSSE